MAQRFLRKAATVWRSATAALFGAALALRAEQADYVVFGTDSKRLDVPRGGSVLRFIGTLQDMGGTDTVGAIQRWYRPGYHDRVVILTDEQADGFSAPSTWGAYRNVASAPGLQDVIRRSRSSVRMA